MICIYSKTNTDYEKNGDAVLNPISCTLTMTINGAWQLNLEHPYDSEGKYKIIKEGAVLRVDLECISELSTVRQLFRIYNYSKGMHSVTAIAFPVAMESTYDAPVDNLVIDNMTGAQVFAELQEYTDKYTLYTDVTKTKSASYSNTNINEIIASGGDTSFIKLWGGEILYDNLNYKVLSSLGNPTADFRIKYGRNLMGITYQVDDSGLITRLYPISADNIRLDVGYVQSDNAGLYPVIHSQFVNVPYTLIQDDATSPSRTAKQTRNSMSAITTSANSTSHSAYATALDGGYQPDYIKSIRASIISAVITQALNGVVSTDLYNLASKTITSAMNWMGSLEQPEWEWQGSYEDGWWYGNSDGYAKNQYMRIGKKWRYFGAEGYWEEPKDDSEEWDWHQPIGSSGKRYGNYRKYFAHDEYVYITMDGTLKSYWFNEEGWYEEGESGDSTWDWHGTGTAEDPYWFGEEGASADDERKYAHDCWLFIDGSLYFFDSFGYYAPGTQMSDYQWDWVQSDERWWFGNAEDKEYAATYLVSQWEKINGTWYYFDANGYVVAENTSKANAIAVFTSGMSALTTVCSAQKTILYELLYDLMEEYCGKLFDQGIDYPMVSVTADMVDLSQTVDYAEFSDLEKVNLGDSVKVVDDEHNISYSNRVVGITYDCIRKYNSVVTLGTAVASVQQIVGNANGTPAVSSGIDTSAISTQIGNMVKDVRFNEVSLVNNGIATLDDVITEVEANPSGTATVDLTKLRVDDVIYQLAGSGGNANIDYGYDVPTGGSDKDVYFLIEHGYEDLTEIGTISSNIRISDLTRDDDIYSYVISGTANSGNDDAQLLLNGLIVGNEYVLKFDLQFDESVTSFIGGHYNTSQIWVNGSSSEWGDNIVYLVDDYDLHSYSMTFTATRAEGTVFALCMNNCVDADTMRGLVTNLRVEGEFNRQYDSDYDEVIAIYVNTDGIWKPYQTDVKDVLVNGVSVVTNRTAFLENIGNLSGTEEPSLQGGENSIYLQYIKEYVEHEETAWSGSVATSAWASPVKVGNFDLSRYDEIVVSGRSYSTNFRVSITVSEIPDKSSGNQYHTSEMGYAYFTSSNDGTELWLYSQTGYTTYVYSVIGTYTSLDNTKISDIYGKIENEWLHFDLSGKQDVLTAGDNITISNNVISANNIYKGTVEPSSNIGNDKSLYLKYTKSSEESDYSTIWTGNVSTSAWASPVQIGTINPSGYYRIRVTGSYTGGRLVSEIPEYGGSDSWNVGGQMYIYTQNNGTELWLYSGTGYNSIVTRVDATTYGEVPTNIDNVYGNIDGQWLEIETGGSSNVIPNPSEDATQTLNKIKIDDTVYEIQGGGGSSGSAQKDILWSATSGTYDVDLELAHPYTDYDYLILTMGHGSGTGARYVDVYVSVEILEELRLGSRQGYFTAIEYGNGYHNYTVSSTSVLHYIDRNSSTGTLVYQVQGIKCGGGSGGDLDDDDIVLFKNGEWKNTDIMTITSYLATIENGKLHCSGLHAGVIVSAINNLSTIYSLYIYVDSTNGFGYQTGRCNQTTDLNSIIASGTNRISYNNDSVSAGDYVIIVNVPSSTQGAFLGGAYNVSTSDYYITKIKLVKNNKKTYS